MAANPVSWELFFSPEALKFEFGFGKGLAYTMVKRKRIVRARMTLVFIFVKISKLICNVYCFKVVSCFSSACSLNVVG